MAQRRCAAAPFGSVKTTAKRMVLINKNIVCAQQSLSYEIK
jgi:hypothetical protein